MKSIKSSITSSLQKFVENPFHIGNKGGPRSSSSNGKNTIAVQKVSEANANEETEENHAAEKIEESIRQPKDREFQELKIESSIDNLLEESKADIAFENSIVFPQNLQASNIFSFRNAEIEDESKPFTISNRDIFESASQPRGEDHNPHIDDPEASSSRWFLKKPIENVVNRSRNTIFVRTEYLDKDKTKKYSIKSGKKQSNLELVRKVVFGIDINTATSTLKEEEITVEDDEDEKFEMESEGSSDEFDEENALNRSIDTPIIYFGEEKEDPEEVKDIEEYAKFLEYKFILVQRKLQYFKSKYKRLLKDEQFTIRRLRPRKVVSNI